jgi:hypothetical protein
MMVQLKQLAILVVARKESKWQHCASVEPYPLKEINEAGEQRFNQWLDDLEEQKYTWDQLYPCYKNFLSLKLLLDEEPWLIPKSEQAQVLTYFAHDLLFYLMINKLLNYATLLFEGYLNETTYPSQLSLYHRLKISPKKLIDIFQKHLPECSSWLEPVLLQKAPEYKRLQEQLQQLARHRSLPLTVKKLVKTLLKRYDEWPVNQQQEIESLKELKMVKLYLEQYMTTRRWSLLREIVHTCLQLIPYPCYSSEEHLKLFEECSAGGSYDEEYHYWKDTYKQHLSLQTSRADVNLDPGCGHYKQMVLACKKKAQLSTSNTCKQLCHFKLIWNGHPFALLRPISELTRKGELLIDGSSDLNSLTRFITSVIQVRKARQEGYLAYDSVLTYLKKIQCGDI